MDGDIVVSSRRIYEDPWWFRWGLTDFGSGYMFVPGIRYSGQIENFIPYSPKDEDSINVDTNLKRPLEPEERAAYDALKQAVMDDKATIQSLPDSQRIRMYDGLIITKEELFCLYSRIDIRIDDNVTEFKTPTIYDNGSSRGEAVLLPDGDVELHFTIGNIVNYHANGGLKFMIFHELGHVTSQGWGYVAARDAANIEMYANDVAWAMTGWAGDDRFKGFTGSGYSNTPPEFLNFSVGGGGGGGPRNPGSEVPDPDRPPPPMNWSIVVEEDGAAQSEMTASYPRVTWPLLVQI